MNGLFKEVVRRQQRPFWQIVFIVLGAVILLNLLITSCNLLGEKYAGIASIIVLASTISVCGFLIIKIVAYYSYRIADNRLIFERIIGNKSKVILDLGIEEIESIKPYREMEEDKSVAVTYKFICDKDYDNFYVGAFLKDDKKYRFIFKPSSRLLNLLVKDKIAKYVDN
ncbi:hypothetical protein [Sporosalibacterium faouarense]|uniref:hypothetical protein n=1 Tax=Sporosalibacterium faouarense TaxID=516123 RepID=UPI00141C2FEF|nr:hypothetical protein [Sporosalibacterium faouarense]MTI48806.1 hypothetical protein [Bacillota bacterium]